MARPDAIIVQDMAIIQMINELNLNINIHSSVMMNVHNLFVFTIAFNVSNVPAGAINSTELF